MDFFRSAPFYSENYSFFYKTTYLNEEVSCSRPSSLVRVPCHAYDTSVWRLCGKKPSFLRVWKLFEQFEKTECLHQKNKERTVKGKERDGSDRKSSNLGKKKFENLQIKFKIITLFESLLKFLNSPTSSDVFNKLRCSSK